jgi:Carbohydrate family 9 binding domain-like
MRFLSNILSSLSSASTAALYFTAPSEHERGIKSPTGMTNTEDVVALRPRQHEPENEYRNHWDLYPRSYTVNRMPAIGSKYDDNMDSKNIQLPKPAFHIDGNIEKDVWQNVPWSDSFGDIQGKDEHEPKNIIPPTRFKAMYDDSYLYVAAILHPATGLTTEAHFTERNAPIYQRDSDFEIFIDVDNTNHMYKELEINAINTVWNLLLDKPYVDGGVEHSGRIAKIGESLYYEVSHQHTASRVISGTLNNENNHTGALWSVEMALSYKDILSNTTVPDRNFTPTNSFWRVNFSRVEKQGKINWTWQPQTRWNPETRQFNGFVQMHLPDAWGYFFFSDEYVGTSVRENISYDIASSSRSTKIAHLQSTHRDSFWPEKLTAMTIYYALHYYKDQNGRFTDDISELTLPADIVAPFCCEIQLNQTDESDESFLVRVYKKAGQNTSIVQVRDDRLLEIVQSSLSDE